MISPEYLVVQSVRVDNAVDVFMSESRGDVWTFEQNRGRRTGDGELFPFVLDSPRGLTKRMTGAETKVICWRRRQVLFVDDYCVSDGLVIGVLFPKGYAPTVFKFKERPQLPLGMRDHGAVRVAPPSYFEVYYNRHEKRAAVIFHIGSPIFFKFFCLAEFVAGDFPSGFENYRSGDAFEATIRSATGQTLKSNDLERFSAAIPKEVDRDELVKRIGELDELVRAEANPDQISETRSAIERVLLPLSAAGSSTTILDSYAEGGVVGSLIARVLAYFAL